MATAFPAGFAIACSHDGQLRRVVKLTRLKQLLAATVRVVSRSCWPGGRYQRLRSGLAECLAPLRPDEIVRVGYAGLDDIFVGIILVDQN